MYLPWLFNKAKEFQRVGGLLTGGQESQMRPQHVKKQRQADVTPECHELLFRATSIKLAQRRIRSLKMHAENKLGRHRDQLVLDLDPVEFWSEEVVDLIGQITFSIGQLRIMQNVLLAILAKLSKLREVPSSLADAIKRGMRGFQPSIARAVVEYWDAGGSTVKNYRDLDQHFLAIARHSASLLDW